MRSSHRAARLWLAAAVMVAGSWLGCDSGDGPASEGTVAPSHDAREANQPQRIPGPVRLAVDLPRGWLTVGRPLTQLTNPAEVLRLASAPLAPFQRGRNCSPARALAGLPSGDTLILVLHRHGRLGLTRRFREGPLPRRVRLTRNRLGSYECAGRAYSVHFRRRGLTFQAWVYFRPSRGAASQRRVAERVLNSIRVKAHGRRTHTKSGAGAGPPRMDVGPIAALSAALEAPVDPDHNDLFTIGRSAQGRPIRALALNGIEDHLVLAVGCIHGDECAGMRVLEMLDQGYPPVSDVVFVPNLNPDGLALGTRVNSRGVDLNRNFGSGWLPGTPGEPEYPGPSPFSEPETRIARGLIQALEPSVTIWFHQQAEPLVRAWGPSVPAGRRYAQRAGLRFHRMSWLPGSAPNWQNHRFPGAGSFVVELAPGPLLRRAAFDHASAVLAAAG